MSHIKNVNARIVSPTSQFGDHIVNEMTPILQYAFEYDMVNNTEFWTKTETAGGTVTTADAMAVVNTSTTTASVASIESVRPARYRSGFGSKLRYTARFSAPAAGCKQIIGMFDELGSSEIFKNGYGVGYDGTTFKLIHFLNDTDQSTDLSAASIDVLDGAGNSTINLDETKLNILEVNFAYLGTGDIVWQIYGTDGRQFYEINVTQRANLQAVPHSYNPNYKIWLYASNGATTSDVTVYSASIMYAIQGRVKYQEIHQPQQSFNATLGTVTTQTQLFSVRNKSTYTGVKNFIDGLLEAISGSYEANAAGRGVVKVVRNPTLGGVASWTDIHATNSIFEYDTAQTTVSNEGKLIAIIPVAGQFDSIPLTDISGLETLVSPGDEIAVLVESTNSADFNFFLLWKELF